MTNSNGEDLHRLGHLRADLVLPTIAGAAVADDGEAHRVRVARRREFERRFRGLRRRGRRCRLGGCRRLLRTERADAESEETCEEQMIYAHSVILSSLAPCRLVHR
jgi:hypothetical protein